LKNSSFCPRISHFSLKDRCFSSQILSFWQIFGRSERFSAILWENGVLHCVNEERHFAKNAQKSVKLTVDAEIQRDNGTRRQTESSPDLLFKDAAGLKPLDDPLIKTAMHTVTPDHRSRFPGKRSRVLWIEAASNDKENRRFCSPSPSANSASKG
jgi:hypothetical protein